MGLRSEPSTTVRRLSRSAATSAAPWPAVAACSVYVLRTNFTQIVLPPSFATYVLRSTRGCKTGVHKLSLAVQSHETESV